MAHVLCFCDQLCVFLYVSRNTGVCLCARGIYLCVHVPVCPCVTCAFGGPTLVGLNPRVFLRAFGRLYVPVLLHTPVGSQAGLRATSGSDMLPVGREWQSH